MVSRPYVGVTGLVSRREILEVRNEFSDAGYGWYTQHVPMMGFLVSYKTINGQATQNRRYPKFRDLPSLLERVVSDVMPMVHYNSRELDTLPEQVAQVFEDIYKEILCRNVQLNIPWPCIAHVRKIRDKFPEMRIALQLSQKAMGGLSPKGIADKVSDYGKDIDYALIDPSGGRGLDFDLDKSVAICSEIKRSLPELTVGFAGGLTGENVESKVNSLIKDLGTFSFCIDAEGGLRDKLSPEYGDDVLNVQEVRSYLQASAAAFKTKS